MTIFEFADKHKGQIMKDPWGTYRGECVSLVKRFIEANGWIMKRGNAIVWKDNGDDFYKWIPNTRNAVPVAGDIIVFQIGTYGHIGVVVSANELTVDVFNQNYPKGNSTDPAQITRFNYLSPKVLGWLHAKALDTAPVVEVDWKAECDKRYEEIIVLDNMMIKLEQEIVQLKVEKTELIKGSQDKVTEINLLKKKNKTQLGEYNKKVIENNKLVEVDKNLRDEVIDLEAELAECEAKPSDCPKSLLERIRELIKSILNKE